MIELFYMFAELFQILIIYAFADKMLQKKYSIQRTMVGWLVLYVVYRILALTVNNKYINIILYYIFIVLILKIFYNSNMQNKIMTIVHIGIYGIWSEVVVYILMSMITNISDDIYLLTSSISKVVFSLLVRIATIIRNISKEAVINTSLWAGVLLMPVGTSLLCIMQYLINGGFNNTYLEVMFYLVILVLNYFSFNMFDSMQQYVIVKDEKKLLEKETEYYYKQCENIQHMWESLRSLKHNISNQYLSERIMLQNGDYKALEQQYDNMIGMLRYDDVHSKTGNIKIDSIINYKVSQIIDKKGKVVCDINIPKDLKFDTGDMVVVIGNLLDNSIEAIEAFGVRDNKRINNITDIKTVNISMKYQAPNLVICVRNHYIGDRKKTKQGEYLTTKKSEELHGLGLKSVKKTIQKYNGKLVITDEEGMFTVKVHMYI